MQSMRMETPVCPAQRCTAAGNRYLFALSAMRLRCIGTVTGEFDRADVEPVETRFSAPMTAPEMALNLSSEWVIDGAYSS